MNEQPYAVGDYFRVYNRRICTSGTITKINKVNLLYDALYEVGTVKQVMHLKIARHHLTGDGVTILKRKATA